MDRSFGFQGTGCGVERKRASPSDIRLMDKSCITLRTLNYGNYGIFLIMGNAGFCPSTVGLRKIIEGLGLN